MTDRGSMTIADVGVVFVALEAHGRPDVARRFAADLASLSRDDAEAAGLRAELEAARQETATLREELRKAAEAARKRRARRPPAPPAPDPRQERLFERPAAAAGHPDVSPDASDAPCMHASSSFKKRMIMGSPVVSGDPEDPPAWAIELASSSRPDLPEFEVRDLWRWFATRPHVDEADARDHFARVLPKHKASRTKPGPQAEAHVENAPAPPPPPPRRPIAGATVPPRPRPRPIADATVPASVAFSAALLEAVGGSTGPPARASSVA